MTKKSVRDYRDQMYEDGGKIKDLRKQKQWTWKSQVRNCDPNDFIREYEEKELDDDYSG